MEDLKKPNNTTLNPASWVDKYGDYLFRFAVSRLRDGEAAEEVVQETFLAALRHVDQYEAKGSERAWLLGILKRKIIDLIRARNRTTSLAEGTIASHLAVSSRSHITASGGQRQWADLFSGLRLELERPAIRESAGCSAG